jgi:hypothetical protein
MNDVNLPKVLERKQSILVTTPLFKSSQARIRGRAQINEIVPKEGFGHVRVLQMAFDLLRDANKGGCCEIRNVSHNVRVQNWRRGKKLSRVNGPFHDADSLKMRFHEIEGKVRGTNKPYNI